MCKLVKISPYFHLFCPKLILPLFSVTFSSIKGFVALLGSHHFLQDHKYNPYLLSKKPVILKGIPDPCSQPGFLKGWWSPPVSLLPSTPPISPQNLLCHASTLHTVRVFSKSGTISLSSEPVERLFCCT